MSTPLYVVNANGTAQITLVALQTHEESGGSSIDSYQLQQSVTGSNVWTTI